MTLNPYRRPFVPEPVKETPYVAVSYVFHPLDVNLKVVVMSGTKMTYDASTEAYDVWDDNIEVDSFVGSVNANAVWYFTAVDAE